MLSALCVYVCIYIHLCTYHQFFVFFIHTHKDGIINDFDVGEEGRVVAHRPHEMLLVGDIEGERLACACVCVCVMCVRECVCVYVCMCVCM